MEKTVQIRFANYSTLNRSSGGGGLGEFSSIFSSSIMALLGGYLNPSSMNKAGDEMFDRGEEAMLGKSAGDSPW